MSFASDRIQTALWSALDEVSGTLLLKPAGTMSSLKEICLFHLSRLRKSSRKEREKRSWQPRWCLHSFQINSQVDFVSASFCVCVRARGSILIFHQAFYMDSLWPDSSNIPFHIIADFPADYRQLILQAVQHIESSTCIRFVEVLILI